MVMSQKSLKTRDKTIVNGFNNFFVNIGPENFPIACVHASIPTKARLAPRDSSITPDIMIRQ